MKYVTASFAIWTLLIEPVSEFGKVSLLLLLKDGFANNEEAHK